MKRVPLFVFLLASTLFAQTAGAPATRDRPLTQLPYTPSLDIPSMDRGVDPCEDFYQYACGGWIAANPIPPSGPKPRGVAYGKLGEENTQYLWGVLEDAARLGSGRSPVQQKIGDYFEACMDVTAVEKLGSTPLEATLASGRRPQEQA